MNTIIQSIIDIFGKTVEQVKKYGKGLVLWCSVLFCFIGMLIYFLHQNEILLSRFIDRQEEVRTERIEQTEEERIEHIQERREVNVKVYNLLNRFYYEHNCVQDVAIVEYHNTVHNVANKSFLYVSCTFELCKEYDSHLSSIQHINASLFNISNILFQNNGYYQSSINQLKSDDIKLYSTINSINNIQHIYIIEIRDINNVSTAALVVISNQNYSINLENTIKILKENISLLLI